jgi:hypothetical protein
VLCILCTTYLGFSHQNALCVPLSICEKQTSRHEGLGVGGRCLQPGLDFASRCLFRKQVGTPETPEVRAGVGEGKERGGGQGVRGEDLGQYVAQPGDRNRIGTCSSTSHQPAAGTWRQRLWFTTWVLHHQAILPYLKGAGFLVVLEKGRRERTGCTGDLVQGAA